MTYVRHEVNVEKLSWLLETEVKKVKRVKTISVKMFVEERKKERERKMREERLLCGSRK